MASGAAQWRVRGPSNSLEMRLPGSCAGLQGGSAARRKSRSRPDALRAGWGSSSVTGRGTVGGGGLPVCVPVQAERRPSVPVRAGFRWGLGLGPNGGSCVCGRAPAARLHRRAPAARLHRRAPAAR
eukprot:1458007-Pleurochrysis_carterae.AAC.1